VRLQPITVVAGVSVVVLAATIVATAITGANGAPASSVLAPRPLKSPVAVNPPPCALTGGVARGPQVGGVCTGNVRGAFTCVRRGKLLALSIENRFGRRGHSFGLTIVVSRSAGAGRPAEAGAVAQITGLGNVSRWSNRKLRVLERSDGSLEVGHGVLLPEAGTPATGNLTLDGVAACGGP
jgi:hypothetical protein